LENGKRGVCMTVKEIAKICGVSVATVSRVFNEPEKVREDTRKLVLEMSKKYGYSPHSVAKSLRERRTGIYALTVLSSIERIFEDSYVSKFLRGAVTYFSENDLKLVIDVFAKVDDIDELISYYRQLVSSRSIDGVILMDLKNDDPRVALLNDMNFPYICVGRNNNNNFVFVDSDNYLGGSQAGEHMAKLGCKNALFIGGDPSLPFERERRDGFLDGLKSNKYINVLERFGYYEEKKVREILNNLKGQFDGIFCTSDVMAYAALRYCEENGIDVPIIGFDNILLSEIAGITTVDQHIEVVGQKAAEKLHMLSIGENVESEVVKTELIIRGTKKFLIS